MRLKIEELQIYGYGKFENQHFILGKSNFSVIYGENEAGKSTIMSFIHSILFGFPTKQQSENRYEPKRATSYGGYLIATLERGQRIKIERLPGKFGGEVLIEYEDGTTANEEFLQTLLGGVDKESYRSIFSFDVHGLQQIQKLDANQIGKYLFLSSIYGADALFAIEDHLTKQLDLLYKPNGRRPTVNEGLVKLKEHAGKLQEAKRKNHQYEQLQAEKASLHSQLSSITQTKRDKMAEQRYLEKAKTILPLVKEKKWCNDQLRQLSATDHLPEDGLNKLDHFHVTLQPLNMQLHAMQVRIAKLEEEESELHVNDAYIVHKTEIGHVREQLSLYEEKLKNKQYIKNKIEQLQHEYGVLKQRLYPFLTEDDILNIQATMMMKDTLKRLLEQEVKSKHRKQLLDEQFEQVQSALEEAEWKIGKLKTDVLRDEERSSLEQELTARKNANLPELKQEHKQVSTELKKRKQEYKGEKKQQSIFLSVITLILLIGSTWLFFQENWPLFGILLVACIGVLFQIKNLQTKKDTLVEHLESELKVLEQRLYHAQQHESTSGRALSDIITSLEKDQMVKQSLQHEEHILEQQERAYERLLKQYEEWEKNQFYEREQLLEIAEQIQVETNASSEVVLEAFEALQHLQSLIMELNKYRTEVRLLNQEQWKFEEEVKRLAEICQIERSSIKESVYILGEQSSLELSNAAKREKIKEKQAEIEEELTSLSEEIVFIEQQRDELIRCSKCETEDEFRKLAKVHLQREEIQRKMQWVEKQLATESDLDPGALSNEKIETIDVRIQELVNEIDQMEKMENQLQQEYSSILFKIEEMEQSGTYSKLRHAFENERAMVKDEAEKWIIRALAKDLLQKTVHQHREEKLPELLASITYYFQLLTSNSYQKVYLPIEKQSFIVERQDGVKFFAEELSQATAEQLYLSIRLAIIKNINSQLQLPVIIDDSFVHFDHSRTSNTLKLLHELKKDQQVIFFTCHHHIAESAQPENMVNLSDTTNIG